MAFNLGNLKVGLLLDAGQVFSGLRQVNKELLGLQRTQERFNQLTPPRVFSREDVALARERLAILQAEIPQQKLRVFEAQEAVRIARQEVDIIRQVSREDTAARTAAIKLLRDQAAERIRAAKAEVDRVKAAQGGFAVEQEQLRLLRLSNEQRRNAVEEEKRLNAVEIERRRTELKNRSAALAARQAETERLLQIGGRGNVDASGKSVARRLREERQESKDVKEDSTALGAQEQRISEQLLKTEQDIRREAERILEAEKQLAIRKSSNLDDTKRQQAVLKQVRDDGVKAVTAENRALEQAQASSAQRLRDSQRQLIVARDELHAEQLTTKELQAQGVALERNVSAADKAAEAARKQQVIAENIRDAILALGLGTALQSLNKFSAEAALLAARVENLGTVLRNLGTVSGNSLGQLTLYEEQVKKLGITTQAARQVLSLLAANQQDLAQSATLARVAQDAAAIAGINSSEAAERLVVAVERLDTRLLRSLGIVVNLREVYASFARETGRAAETLSAAEKQQLLYNAVIERGAAIQGTYEASLKDAFKQFTSLDRITQEARREFGERLVPVFEKYVEVITDVVGADENSGLRRLNKENGKGLVALQAFVTAAGAATIAAIGLSRAYALLGISAKASALATLGLSGALRAVLATLVSPAGLLITAIGALAAGYTYYGAQAREAAQSQRLFSDALTSSIQRGVDLEDSYKTIRVLGSASSRTAQQQEELGRAFRVVAGIFPEYSAELKQVEKDTVKYEAVLKKLGARIGLYTEQEAESKQQIAEASGRAIGERLRAAVRGEVGGRLIKSKLEDEAKDRLAATFGITRDDLAVFVGDIRDTKRELEVLQKFSNVKDSDPEVFAKDLARAFSVSDDALINLSNHFKETATNARALRDAQNAVAAQRFARDLDRQAGAAETFGDEIKRQQTKIRQELSGTAAEDIEQFRKIRTALGVRFQTEEDLRKGAERQKQLAISSARQELQLEIDIAAAKVKAFNGDKDSLDLKSLELDLQKKRNALQTREVAAEDEADKIVKQGVADLEIRAKALKTIEERIERTLVLNRKLRDLAKEQNDLDVAGLRARQAGRDATEVETQVAAVKRLLDLEKSRAETQEKIKTIQEETDRALKGQEDQLAKLKSAKLEENSKTILQLEKSIKEERDLSALAIEQQNEALRAQQIEVKKLAQDQLADVKNLVKGFNDARSAREAFDSPQAVAERARANQQALTAERVRQEQAGASQIEVEAALANIRNEQAAAESKKRQELDKTFQTEQQRSKGAFREQRQLEQELKRQGLDPRKRQRDPFAAERGVRAQETAKILGLLRPDGSPLPPGEAEKALADFRLNNQDPNAIQTILNKNPASFPSLFKGQGQAEKLLGVSGDPSALMSEAQAAGEQLRKQKEIVDGLVVVKTLIDQKNFVDAKILTLVQGITESIQTKVVEVRDRQDKMVEWANGQARGVRAAAAGKGLGGK